MKTSYAIQFIALLPVVFLSVAEANESLASPQVSTVKKSNKAKLENAPLTIHSTAKPIVQISEKGAKINGVAEKLRSPAMASKKNHLEVAQKNMISASGGGSLSNLMLNQFFQMSQSSSTALRSEGFSDSEIVSHIQKTMASNNEVSDVNIEIHSKHGVVTLSGEVNNYIESNTLIIISESTPGVKEVNVSQLVLKNKTRLSKDAIISAKIRGTFIREGLFFNNKLNPIKVITFNGVVTLIGAVAKKNQVVEAIELAKSVDGVNKVKSQIVVSEVEKGSKHHAL